jgi:hypothetical protein
VTVSLPADSTMEMGAAGFSRSEVRVYQNTQWDIPVVTVRTRYHYSVDTILVWTHHAFAFIHVSAYCGHHQVHTAFTIILLSVCYTSLHWTLYTHWECVVQVCCLCNAHIWQHKTKGTRQHKVKGGKEYIYTLLGQAVV